MKPVIVFCALAILFASRSAVAFCDLPPAASIDDAVAYFQTTTFALQHAEAAGSATLKAMRSPGVTPFDAVYALKSNVVELQCAQSAVARFNKSSTKNIALSATAAVLALNGVERAVQGMLARVNALLGSAPPSQAQVVNASADEALKGQDAMDLLVNAAEMSAMGIRACDTSTNKCNKLLLNRAQRQRLAEQWSAMSHADDAIGHLATAVTAMLRNPKFESAPTQPTGERSPRA